MQLIRGLVNLKPQSGSCVATIGNFDGVHCGHQAIIQRILQQAKSQGLPSCVVLFEPHPKEYFVAQDAPARITCFAEKYQQLARLGVDKLLVLRFNRAMSEMKAEDFVAQILIQKLKVSYLVVGDDFHFGHKRQGNFALLDKMSKGNFGLEPTPSVIIDQQRVSSTLLREYLAANAFDKVYQLLNRRYSIAGKVGFGQQIGRSINVPTANVAIKRKKLPISGVFLVKCRWQGNGEQFVSWGVANCGARPTVDGKNYRLEVHLLGVSPCLYGIELTVEFFQAIRAEKKFDDLTQLKAQIFADIKVARSLIKQFE